MTPLRIFRVAVVSKHTSMQKLCGRFILEVTEERKGRRYVSGTPFGCSRTYSTRSNKEACEFLLREHGCDLIEFESVDDVYYVGGQSGCYDTLHAAIDAAQKAIRTLDVCILAVLCNGEVVGVVVDDARGVDYKKVFWKTLIKRPMTKDKQTGVA